MPPESHQSGSESDKIAEDLHQLAERIAAQGGETELARWIDIISAFLLSAAVVLSAFSAWQATLWGGQQSTLYAEAGSLRTVATQELATGLTEIGYDAGVWVDGILAYVAGDQAALEAFDERIYRKEFKTALDAWIDLEPLKNPDAPRTPFDMEEYKNSHEEKALELTRSAEDKFKAGKEANANGDDYILSTVFFAAVLFFAGITTKFKSDWLRSGGVVIASIALIVGLVWLVSLPRIEI